MVYVILRMALGRRKADIVRNAVNLTDYLLLNLPSDSRLNVLDQAPIH